MHWKLILGTIVMPLAVGVCVLSASSTLGGSTPHLPRPDHIVMVIEENHSYSQIIDSPDAPYINSLAARAQSSHSPLASPTPANRTISRCFQDRRKASPTTRARTPSRHLTLGMRC